MKNKKLISLILVLLVAILAAAVWGWHQMGEITIKSPVGTIVARPLDQYTFENLKKRGGKASHLIDDGNGLFHYFSDGRRVSGTVNYAQGKFRGYVVMLHGSADLGEYFPGFGTQPVAAVLAKNGFTTYAPDFFGYGTSDKSVPDVFADRFQTYTVTLDLIASIEQNSKFKNQNAKLMIWGHSNGGQIALSVLEITGADYPTVLWNPVSESFPYNILFFTNTYADHGKWLRAALARFEALYDVEKYSTPNFYGWINAPILLQQAGADEWVPKSWSDKLNEKLKLKIENYIVYPGANHNMVPDWNAAVADTLNFFKKNE
ncbi:MAG: alpha/beta fold hydrolase [Patescibacteria group bacterium]|nr:alpha/beta fold hydrolase [Patescibacteria group bacterium]MCL5432215.1 alpha/beta fold hydrolase [Patescibacteria group bacterium]